MPISIRLSDAAYGGTPGTGDNTAAINAWFAALMGTAGAIGVIDDYFPYASPVIWDFASRPWGVKITSERGLGRLQYTGTTGKGLQAIHSGGSSVGSVSVAGLVIEDVDFDCDFNGVGFQIGSDNGYDVFESCHIIRPRIINNNSAGVSGAVTAAACRIVGMNTSQWDAPIFNCKAATNNTTAKGSGAALEIVHMISSTFNSPSPSNAAVGVHYTNLGNSMLGFIHGNVFNAPDFENLEHAIYSETTNGALGWETYIGGTVDLVGGGYPVSLKNGSGFFGAPVPSGSINWICPPWNPPSGTIKNASAGFSATGISVIVS